MSRQVRMEFPGATYHVVCRGDRLGADGLASARMGVDEQSLSFACRDAGGKSWQRDGHGSARALLATGLARSGLKVPDLRGLSPNSTWVHDRTSRMPAAAISAFGCRESFANPFYD